MMSETCVCGAKAKWIVVGGWLHDMENVVIACQCDDCYTRTCATNQMQGRQDRLDGEWTWTYRVDELVAEPL